MASLLEALGNLVDVPGSMVRDAVTLRNPLDQLLSPFSQEGRTTGEQVINDYGGGSGHSFLGALLEMGLDPTTYLGIGPAMKLARAGYGAGLVGKAKNAATAGYDAAKAGLGAAKTALSSPEGAKAALSAGWDAAKSVPGQLKGAFNNATHVGSFDVPYAWKGLGNYIDDAYGAVDAAGRAIRPVVSNAKNATYAGAPLTAAFSRTGNEGMEEPPQMVNTPQGPMMIPGGARFSIGGINNSESGLPVPPWATQFRYSLNNRINEDNKFVPQIPRTTYSG